MKTIAPELRAALLSNAYRLALALAFPLGNVGIDRVRFYAVHETGRLGRADLEVVLDNADGGLTTFGLRPGLEFTSSEGLDLGDGNVPMVTRHRWTLQTVDYGQFGDLTNTIRLKARNGWEKFAAGATAARAWSYKRLIEILVDLSNLAGVIPHTDGSNHIWHSWLDEYTVGQGWPLQPAMSVLMGDGHESYGRVYGRFDADGGWTLRGWPTTNEVEVMRLGGAGEPRVLETDVITEVVPTRIVLTSTGNTLVHKMTALEALQGEGGVKVLNLPHLVSNLDYEHRLEQEGRELYAQRRRLKLHTDVTLELQLQDVIALTGCGPTIADGSTWVVDEIHLVYKSGAQEGDEGALSRWQQDGLSQSITVREIVNVTYDELTGDLQSWPLPPLPWSDTVADDFALYGGDEVAQAGSAGLNWLSLIEGEGDADEYGSGFAIPSTTHVVQGLRSISMAGIGQNWAKSGVFDLTAEGRFEAGDFFVAAVYGSGYVGMPPRLRAIDGGSRYAYAELLTVAGWNYLSIKRAELVVDDGFDWSNVVQFDVANFGDAITLDDVRIAKADPIDATTFNDTGGVWQFAGGVWHVYQDVPAVAFALGQIDARTAGARYAALRTGAYQAGQHFACGVRLREAGTAGLLAMAYATNYGYEALIDTTAKMLMLNKRAGETITTLANVSMPTLAINTSYWLGVQRRGQWLDVYLSADGDTLFAAANLKAHVADMTYLVGKIGVVAYGVNARFFHVRAGSPEHALTAEYAFEADTVDGRHADEFAAVEHVHADGESFTTHTHVQAVPAAVWAVAHNLGRKPSVTVIDSANSEVLGNVTYVSDGALEVAFSGAFSGLAYLV